MHYHQFHDSAFDGFVLLLFFQPYVFSFCDDYTAGTCYLHLYLYLWFCPSLCFCSFSLIWLMCARWFGVYSHPAPPPLIAPAKLLVGCRAPGVCALPVQPSRLHFSALRWRGPLRLPPRFCGQTLWLASPWLRETRDPEARGARSNRSRAAEMGRAVPLGGVSPWGVQARGRGNKHRMWVTVVCFS